MKKMLAMLFCAFVFTGTICAEEPSHAIDDTATHSAIWKVGDIILKANLDSPEYAKETRFLGVTTDGNFLVQEFYLRDESKATDPYLVNPSNVSYLGPFKSYYLTGEKWSESYHSPPYEVNTIWSENGNIYGLMFLYDANTVGIIWWWDESGYLSSMSVFGEHNQLLTWMLFNESGRIVSMSLHNPQNPNLECTWDFGRLVIKEWECPGAE